MYKRFGWVLIAVLLLGLGGCGPAPQLTREEPPESLLGPDSRIGLLTIQDPALYDARILRYPLPANPGVTLPGRIVGAGVSQSVRQADRASRNYELTQTIEQWNFSVAEDLTENIARHLQAVGYNVLDVPVDEQRHAGSIRGFRFLGDYPAQPSQSFDAYLHVYVEFAGYTALSPNEPYVPTLEVFVDLVSADSKERLYATSMVYGGPIPVEGATDMPADPQYSVRDFAWLCADEEQCDESPAVRGLRAASDGIAQLIARNLK
ncbi:MAG: hypothetical protein SVU69_00860 [Pseudomonadota bacterium]|nr:hypothetical protein [Pseudomonadota bacterium]